MNCSACQHQNLANAKFCVECGQALQATCASCKAELTPNAKFCHECGTPVAGAVADTVAGKSAGDRQDSRNYTPKHLADRILANRSAMEGEKKQVTVLFCDVAGSMDLAEALGAEAWHDTLNEFFEVLTAAVHEHEGTVNQYTGDGIMALFGAPIAAEDHARRACMAALAIQEKLGGLRQKINNVIPAEAGIHSSDKGMDSRLRGNDGVDEGMDSRRSLPSTVRRHIT